MGWTAKYERLRFEWKAKVLTIWLTGSTKINACDGVMHRELASVFRDAQDDLDSELIVLTGAGDYFSAGGDMEWFRGHISDPKSFRAILVEAKRIILDLIQLEKPIICRLNGPAAGLGATIALLCDVIVARESARIGDPHVRAGLVAGDGGAIIWPQLIGYARAKELLLTGKLITAKEAERFGLINYVVEDDLLDQEVENLAHQILSNPRWAVRWTKVAMNLPLQQLATQISDAALAYEALSNETDDRMEAVESFIAHRTPIFKGY